MVTTDLLTSTNASPSRRMAPARLREPLTDVAPLIAELRGQGLTCAILRIRVAGELDVRLQASRPETTVTVELLGPAANGTRWAAVRVDGDDRQIWHGPDSPDAGPLADFVADLLVCTKAILEQRYLLLG